MDALEARVVRTLDLAGGLQHLSAASGLVRIGQRIYVVADDELSLGVFDLAESGPGTLLRLISGELPIEHHARKAAKPDFEALLHLPVLQGHPHGALVAVGSGSRATRQRGALLALDAAGLAQGSARAIDLSPLLAPLQTRYGDLNIEGAFVDGQTVRLLQRGNTGHAVNEAIAFAWPAVRRWLEGTAPAPAAVRFDAFDLGSVDGVPLSFTDGTAVVGGAAALWAFSAAAEDTADSYADGRCAGSAIGLVASDGRLVAMARLRAACKVEGIVATARGDAIELLMVTDADDRAAPASLLAATLPLP